MMSPGVLMGGISERSHGMGGHAFFAFSKTWEVIPKTSSSFFLKIRKSSLGKYVAKEGKLFRKVCHKPCLRRKEQLLG